MVEKAPRRVAAEVTSLTFSDNPTARPRDLSLVTSAATTFPTRCTLDLGESCSTRPLPEAMPPCRHPSIQRPKQRHHPGNSREREHRPSPPNLTSDLYDRVGSANCVSVGLEQTHFRQRCLRVEFPAPHDPGRLQRCHPDPTFH